MIKSRIDAKASGEACNGVQLVTGFLQTTGSEKYYSQNNPACHE